MQIISENSTFFLEFIKSNNNKEIENVTMQKNDHLKNKKQKIMCQVIKVVKQPIISV